MVRKNSNGINNPLWQMTCKPVFTLLAFCLCLSTVKGQEGLRIGFRAGLTYNTLNGDELENESYNNTSSFHIGILGKYYFSDLFGITTELLYIQKGGNYRFDGSSFFRFRNTTGADVLIEGQRNMRYDINNSFLEIPVMAFTTLGPVEISAGLGVGFLVASTGGGNFSFTESIPRSDDIESRLDYRFIGDVAGGFLGDAVPVTVGTNREFTIPTIFGAYYELDEKPKNQFKGIDFSAYAGASVYLNPGLFVGARAGISLGDISNNEVDVDYNTFTNNQPTQAEKSLRYFTLQISLGFSF